MRLNLPVTVVEQTFGEQQRLTFATEERVAGMSQKMVAASQEQSRVAEEVSQQINNVTAAVQKTAGNANAAVIRGRELESISSGLRALVERFNR